MKIVTLYNHKGGVSKTTSTFNLASYLAGEGKKVLMVDADPQCNLTEIAMAPVIEKLDMEAENANLSKVPELPGTSILEALNQRIQGDAAFIDIDKISTVEVGPNLFLLKGSVDLSSIEDDLSESHLQRMAMRTNLMRTYVATGDFLVRLADQEGFDYIFIDVGPSSGALTRTFFLVCDAFFVPVAPDRFNVQAISTLSRILERWITDHALVKEQYEDLGLPIRHGMPAFLGAIVQAFKFYAGKPKPGFRLWMDRLPVEIESRLKSVFKTGDDGVSEKYLPNSDNPIATEIPDFNQLAPLMQEVGKAVFNVTQDDTARITTSGKPWVGNNWTQAQERMNDYRNRLSEVASILTKLS